MSGRQSNVVRGASYMVQLLGGRVRPNGATTVMAEAVGSDFTVVRTGTGAYKLTTRLQYKVLLSCQLTLCSATLVGVLRKTGPGAANALGQFEIPFEFQQFSAGAFAAADIPAAALNWIDVALLFKDSVLPP